VTESPCQRDAVMSIRESPRESRPPQDLMNAAAQKHSSWNADEYERLDKKHPRVVGKELAELMTLKDHMPKGYRSKCIASHGLDRKSTRLNSSHSAKSRMPSSA
jgi:hypothetical protein